MKNFGFRISDFGFPNHTPLGLRKAPQVEEGSWNFGFRISDFGFAGQPPLKLSGGRGKNPKTAMRIFGWQVRQLSPHEKLECAMDKSEIRNPKSEIWSLRWA